MYRRYSFSLFVLAVFALVAGLLIVGIATFVIGNGWRRAIEPWFDYGMWLILIAAVATQVSGFMYVGVSRTPAAVFVAALALCGSAFAWYLCIDLDIDLGVPTVGFGGDAHDPLVIVGSLPVAAGFWLGVPTFAVVVVTLLTHRAAASLPTS